LGLGRIQFHEASLSEPSSVTDALASEVARRRTFAIISHPDAGKTTLTEKLLLYAGAIELAGAVRGSRSQRKAASDWMEIEQQRGISISTAALEFELEGCHVTLLDTPGHQDFSEDTYRTLLAVDSVVMVLDAAKGVEPRTLNLFEVCKAHALPVLTFVNKLDQPALDPFALLDEIERTLGLAAAPMNWPLGDGPDFRGVYDLKANSILFYERSERRGRRTAPVGVTSPDDAEVTELIGEKRQQALIEAAGILEGAGTPFDHQAYLDARQTPVFFGSAINDFGVEPFLHALLKLAPPPGPRRAGGRIVAPTDRDFSGFVFKIQANMNPRHRDRVAFLRICSGKLEKDKQVWNSRLGEQIRLSRVYRFFGRDRETVPEAYPGDVVGIVLPGRIAIGDTLGDDKSVSYPAIEQFPPEQFAYLRPSEGRHKRFDDGVAQLAEEGLLQAFMPTHGQRFPIIGVIGALQLDVIAARMGTEYGIPCVVDRLPHVAARWPVVPPGETLIVPTMGVLEAVDRQGRQVLVFESEWAIRYTTEKNPKVDFRNTM
jgi:peptide chain release factor 3